MLVNVFGKCLEMVAMGLDMWMMSMSFFFNDCIEAMMLVSYIVNNTFSAIWLIKPVLSFDLITMPCFPGFFMVMCVLIFDSVAIFIVNRCLQRTKTITKVLVIF